MANRQGCNQQRVRSVLPYFDFNPRHLFVCFLTALYFLYLHYELLRGRNLSLDFLRRPSKRQYPDYYQLVQRPIALDDIKKQLDTGAYHTFESIRQDFELCFNNAKQYNVKNSDIWKDAKDLLVGDQLTHSLVLGIICTTFLFCHTSHSHFVISPR